jgi:AraC-like DNA-binding protein
MGQTEKSTITASELEKSDAPLLCLKLARPVDRDLPLHAHSRGQLFSLRSGLVIVQVQSGTWALPPHCCAWIPPNHRHAVRSSGPVVGWCLFVAGDLCTRLPTEPCVLTRSSLLEALIDRFSTWDASQPADAAERRLVKIFQDEVATAMVQPLHLPLPRDERLRRVLDVMSADLGNTRTIADWAAWSGMSKRTLTRSFRKETGMTFAGWRQQARLFAALEKLSNKESVTNVALGVGYSSVSAFIDVFRRTFGVTPGAHVMGLPGLRVSELAERAGMKKRSAS